MLNITWIKFDVFNNSVLQHKKYELHKKIKLQGHLIILMLFKIKIIYKKKTKLIDIKKMEEIKNQNSQSKISDNERIKTLENELELKNEIIKSKDEIINSKEEMNKSKIKNLENKNIRGFLNPKYVKMKYNQKEYIFRSKRFWKEDKINVENTKLHINSLNHKGSKFIF